MWPRSAQRGVCNRPFRKDIAVKRIVSFRIPSELVMGAGSINRIASVTSQYGTRGIIVTDPGVVKAGVLDTVKTELNTEATTLKVFDGVQPDPKMEIVQECAEYINSYQTEYVIGLGGGSALDIAKVASIVARHGGEIDDYIGIDKTPGRGYPTILIPTTAGTGSEVTPVAVLTDEANNLKKGVVSDHLYADAALVDPHLTLSVPPIVTAYTGIDTLTHAIEAYTNKYSIPFVDTFALQSVHLVGKHLRRAVMCGDDISAREGMALASTYGGMCLGCVNTAAVHALAYPLGGTFHVPHGIANSLLLPYVMEFNLPSCIEKYVSIAQALGETTEGLSVREAADKAVRAVRSLAEDTRIPLSLSSLNIPKKEIPAMAKAALQVTRLLRNNPRQVTEEDVQDIYEAAY